MNFSLEHDQKPGTGTVSWYKLYDSLQTLVRTPVRGLGYTPSISVRKIEEFSISEHVQIGKSPTAICTMKYVYFDWPNTFFILCRVY